MISSLYIDGIDICQTYEVVASAVGSYAKPSRNVSMQSVAGRNGDIVLDNGSYNNINITYKCVIPKHFNENFNALMGFLYSRSGYVRIEDSEHMDSYRMGVFVDELAPSTVMGKIGSFELTFNCKPQRFLKSGESAITYEAVSSGEYTKSGYTMYEYTWDYIKANYDSDNVCKQMYFATNDAYRSSGNTIRAIVWEVPANYVNNYLFKMVSDDGTVGKIGVSVYLKRSDTWYSFKASVTCGGNSTEFYKPEYQYPAVFCVASLKSIMNNFYVDGSIVRSDAGIYRTSINNPSYFDALPTLEISGLGTYATSIQIASIGTESINLKKTDTTWDTLFIDAETMSMYAYDEEGNMVNEASNIDMMDQITLPKGSTDITIKPGLTMKLKPRWWTL